MLHHCVRRVGVIGVFTFAGAALLGAQPIDEESRAQAYRQFMLGLHLEDEGDLDGAIDALRGAAALDPGSGEPLAALAELYSRSSRPEEAMAAARSAIEREPGNLTARRILGLIHASSASTRDGTPEDAAEAITHLEQARGTILPDLQVELTLARLYLRSDRAQDAVDLLEELRRADLASGQAALLLSRAYEQLGRTEEALATLEAAAASGRPSFRVLERLGQLYERQRRWDDAVEAYERAVARNVRSANVRRRLANALVASGNAEGARDVLGELIRMRPRDAEGLYLLADVELELNNFDAAEAAARQLIDIQPDSLYGPAALSRVFERRREFRRVVETLEPAIEAARRQGASARQLASLFGRLGYAHEQLGSYGRAADVYEDAVEMMPSSLAFGVRLAQTYVNAGRPAEAMRVIERSRAAHPDSLALARLEALVLDVEGSVDEAGIVLERALEANRSQPVAYVVLADHYSRQDRVDDAVTLLEAARERFPGDTSVLFQLGAVLEQHDRIADAERAFRQVLDSDPDHAPALNYLGYMLADRGIRLQESVALLRRAIALDPHNGSYLDSLGWAYFKLDRLDLAEAPLRAAGDQMPDNSVVQDHLGDLLHRLGRPGEAIRAWERALAGDGDEINPETIERKIDDARRERQ
jgi:tetratricopeptide (TPR) repeat protein